MSAGIVVPSLKGACDAVDSAGEEVQGKGGRRKPMTGGCLFPRTSVNAPCRTTTLLELRRAGIRKGRNDIVYKML